MTPVATWLIVQREAGGAAHTLYMESVKRAGMSGTGWSSLTGPQVPFII